MMLWHSGSSIHYTPIEMEDSSDCSEPLSKRPTWRDAVVPLPHVLAILGSQVLLWIASLVMLYSFTASRRPGNYFPLNEYFHDVEGNSYPAASAISYETIVFAENKSYMSSIDGSLPTAETDKLWQQLQEPTEGVIQASAHLGFEIDRLPVTNISTVDPRYHVYGLEVFHQLHCLDRIRKSFHAEHYFPNDTKEELIWHREHCIDHLRQGIMCSGDIAMDRWEYDPEVDMSWLKTDVPHVCRSFNSLSDWAKKWRYHARDWKLFEENGRTHSHR